jgi:hypothetical protein
MSQLPCALQKDVKRTRIIVLRSLSMSAIVAHNGKGIYAVVAFPVPSVLVEDIKLI